MLQMKIGFFHLALTAFTLTLITTAPNGAFMSQNRCQLKMQIEKRARALDAFNRWEATRLSSGQNSEQIFASLGTLYALLPPQSRHKEGIDHSGIRTMHRMLRHLK